MGVSRIKFSIDKGNCEYELCFHEGTPPEEQEVQMNRFIRMVFGPEKIEVPEKNLIRSDLRSELREVLEYHKEKIKKFGPRRRPDLYWVVNMYALPSVEKALGGFEFSADSIQLFKTFYGEDVYHSDLCSSDEIHLLARFARDPTSIPLATIKLEVG